MAPAFVGRRAPRRRVRRGRGRGRGRGAGASHPLRGGLGVRDHGREGGAGEPPAAAEGHDGEVRGLLGGHLDGDAGVGGARDVPARLVPRLPGHLDAAHLSVGAKERRHVRRLRGGRGGASGGARGAREGGMRGSVRTRGFISHRPVGGDVRDVQFVRPLGRLRGRKPRGREGMGGAKGRGGSRGALPLEEADCARDGADPAGTMGESGGDGARATRAGGAGRGPTRAAGRCPGGDAHPPGSAAGPSEARRDSAHRRIDMAQCAGRAGSGQWGAPRGLLP